MGYVTSSVRTISLVFLGFTGALLGITAIEKAAFLVSVALKYRIGLFDYLFLFATTLPDFVDLMLPVGVLVATYLVVLSRREGREFLILASAGVGKRPLMLIGLGAGMAAVMASILMSGFVKPAAAYAFRRHYAEIFSAGLSKGALGSRFYKQDGQVMLVAPAESERTNHIRVFAFDADRLKRVTVSNCANLKVVRGEVVARLCGGDIYLLDEAPTLAGFSGQLAGQGCRLCPTADGKLGLARLRVEESSLAFAMGKVFDSIDTARTKDMNLFSLLSVHGGRFVSVERARAAAGYFLLAESCMIAVALALGAVSISTYRTRPIALAGAIGLMMGIIVLVRSGLLLTGPLDDVGYFLALVGTGGAVAIAAVAAVILSLHGRLITPGMARA